MLDEIKIYRKSLLSVDWSLFKARACTYFHFLLEWLHLVYRFQPWFWKISFLIFQRLQMLLLNQIHLKNFWFSLPYFLQLELVYEQIYSSRLVCCLLPVENTINDSSNLDTHICPCLLRQHADKFVPQRKKMEPYYVCR